mgnify:CR=1 FL=1
MKKMMINHLIAGNNLRPAGDMDSPPAMSIPSLLGLEGMGVKWWGNYPKDEVWLTPKLRCRHGNTAKKGGGTTSKSILKDTFVSEVLNGEVVFLQRYKEAVGMPVADEDKEKVLHAQLVFGENKTLIIKEKNGLLIIEWE